MADNQILVYLQCIVAKFKYVVPKKFPRYNASEKSIGSDSQIHDGIWYFIFE